MQPSNLQCLHLLLLKFSSEVFDSLSSYPDTAGCRHQLLHYALYLRDSCHIIPWPAVASVSVSQANGRLTSRYALMNKLILMKLRPQIGLFQRCNFRTQSKDSQGRWEILRIESTIVRKH